MKLLLVLPFLAAAESTYQGVASSRIGETLVQIAALSVIAVAILNLVDRMRGGTTQKREVSFSQEFATKEELKQAHGRMNREREELDAKIDEIRDQNQRLSEKVESTKDELQERIDVVPERVIKLLRETKGLI